MSNDDQFFEEEESLARQQAGTGARAGRAGADARREPVRTAARGSGSPTSSAPAPSKRRPPSFALVVAIAAVSLILGICVGYFIAMAVVDHSSTSNQVVQTTQSGSSASTGAEDESGMPEGHPDISSMLNADGSVNEEAVEAYKAERATEQAEEGDGEDAEASSADAGDASEDEAETAE